MSAALKLNITIVLIASLGVCSQKIAQAVQLRDGTVYFVQPPQLVLARVTDSSPGVPATYYFSVYLPESAGEPLQRITLTQQTARENIEFNLKRTRAEAKTPSNLEQKLTLAGVTSDSNSKTVSVTFNPPVPAGRTVTVGLRSVVNPLYGGVYLFGVTAYPVGEKTRGQFLGYGRFQFDVPGGRF